MTDNAMTAENGAEIYTSEIYRLADEYIKNESLTDKKEIAESIPSMLLYIHDNIKVVDNDNLEMLDSYFDAYARICLKYGSLPTLFAFGLMVGITKSTFSHWKSREYRKSTKHGEYVQKWKNFCEACLINSLHTSKSASVDKIFTAKAVYGYAETKEVEREEIRGRQVSIEESRREFEKYLAEKEKEKNN